MAAIITIGSVVLASDGITITATVSNGVGALSPSSGITGLSILLSADTTTQIAVASSSISGTTLTFISQAPIASGEVLTVGILSSSNLTDTLSNTATGQSGVAVTNNSTQTITTYVPTNAAVLVLGRLAAPSGGYQNMANSTELVFVVNATTAFARMFQFAAGVLYVSVDGGAFNVVTPVATSVVVLIPLFQGLSAGDHTVSIKADYSVNEYVRVTGWLRVTGGTGAIRAAGLSDGVGYGPKLNLGDSGFATCGDIGAMVATSAIYSSPTSYWNNGFSDAMFRIRGRADTIKIWVLCIGVVVTVTVDNVRIATYTLPNTNQFQLVTLSTGLSASADHDIAVSASTRLNVFVDAIMLVGSTAAFAATTPTAENALGAIGDSIVVGEIGTLDSSLSDVYQLSIQTGRLPINRGINGNKIADVKGRTADITNFNSRINIVLIRVGINDCPGTPLGNAATSGTFIGDYKLTLNQLLAGLTNGQQIIVVAPFNWTATTPNTLNPYRAGIVTAIAACTTPSRCTYLDSSAWILQNNGPTAAYSDPLTQTIDGLHPNVTGEAVIIPLELPSFSSSTGAIGSPDLNGGMQTLTGGI